MSKIQRAKMLKLIKMLKAGPNKSSTNPRQIQNNNVKCVSDQTCVFDQKHIF